MKNLKIEIKNQICIISINRLKNLNAINLDGVAVAIEASGFHAMLLQHECDHLDGILYPMRMTDLSRLSFVSELGPRSRVMAETDE